MSANKYACSGVAAAEKAASGDSFACHQCGDSFRPDELTDADGLCWKCEKHRIELIEEREADAWAKMLHDASKAGYDHIKAARYI